MTASLPRLYRRAFILAVITIVYNTLEGVIATWFGYTDESIALLGFGLDSFIESISGLGILHMVTRIRANPECSRDAYERTALRITGFAFFALMALLVISSAYNIIMQKVPETTIVGVIIAFISLVVMWALVYWKTRVGLALKSDAILADAACTKTCMYMSGVLLLSSALYEGFRVPYVDSLGALAIAWFCFREGKECFEKAQR